MFGTTLRAVRRRAYSYRNSWHDSLSYRDVYVSDSNLDYVNWIKSKPNDAVQIKHPSSKHMVYDYANYVHIHGTYNFNNLGDYVLNVSACQASDSTTPEDVLIPTEQITVPSEHELLIWPDAIRLKHLIAQDISVIGKLLLKDAPLDKKGLADQLNQSSVVCDITEPTIMLAVPNKHTLEHAHRLKEWFELTLSTKHPLKRVNFFVTSGTKHRNERVARALVLPINKQYEDVNSLSKVEQIVRDMRIEE